MLAIALDDDLDDGDKDVTPARLTQRIGNVETELERRLVETDFFASPPMRVTPAEPSYGDAGRALTGAARRASCFIATRPARDG